MDQIFSWICVCASYRICHRAFPEFMWQPQHFNLEFKTNGRWVLFLYQRGWLPQFKANLKKTKTKARILKKYGVPFQMFRYRKHKVFAAGIAVSAVLLFYCSGFVWNIEVKGNSYLSEETILTFLQNENAGFGVPKRNIDCEELEEKLRSAYSEVIWTSVKVYGTKMTVELQENLLPEEEYEAKDDTPEDIVAKKDGVIASMVTRTGTPLVTADMEVKKAISLSAAGLRS